MEKKRREWVDEHGALHWEYVYAAKEVDTLLAAVKALVEAAKAIDPAIDMFNNAREDVSLAKKVSAFNVLFNASDRLTKAIAAVERLGG